MPDKSDTNDELPSATVVKDGKVPGDVPRAPAPPAGKRAYKRRWSNYLLDKKLQLRYVLVVTILSALISGSLGFLIYQQEHRASQDIAASLAAEAKADPENYGDLQKEAVSDMASRDEALVLKMVGTGIGLAVILVLYLVIMTHKVAGPLYKVSGLFDRMSEGKLGAVWPLRKGDMLQDFFASFKDMHDAVRGRLTDDAAAMDRLVAACKAAGLAAPGKGDLAGELEQLAAHVAARKQALS